MGGTRVPRDVLALGHAIVDDLDLPGRGATLERWMAHEVAGLLQRVEQSADGAERSALETRAVRLILDLWNKRWSLPEGFGPVGGYREALATLHRLDPSANPWSGSGGDDADLREMFQILNRCVVGGLLLTLGRARRLVPEEKSAVDGEEAKVIVALERWAEGYVRGEPPRDLRSIYAELASGEARDESRPSDVVGEYLGKEGYGVPDVRRLRAAILEDLEEMQKHLANLLDRWRNAGAE